MEKKPLTVIDNGNTGLTFVEDEVCPLCKEGVMKRTGFYDAGWGSHTGSLECSHCKRKLSGMSFGMMMDLL